MSVSLHVDGRPGPCRRTARQLTRTGQAVADAADFLFRERHRSVDGLDGGAGLAYRERVTTSANDAEMLSRCVAKLGRGLVELADAIEDVSDQMERARDLVAPYDLVRGDRLQEPVDQEGDDPHLVRARRLAYRDAADRVRQARKDEKEAQDDWRATLASYAIDLGEDLIPGIPSGAFLPPVAAPSAPPRQPRDQPSGPERPGTPRPGEEQAEPAHERAAPPPTPMPDAARSGAGPPVLGGHVLGGHVLDVPGVGAHLLEADPLDPSLAHPDPQGLEPGDRPHPEAFHVPCPPDS